MSKVGKPCPTLGQLLASQRLYTLLVGEKQYKIAKARFCTQSYSKVGQLLVIPCQLPIPWGLAGVFLAASPLATPELRNASGSCISLYTNVGRRPFPRELEKCTIRSISVRFGSVSVRFGSASVRLGRLLASFGVLGGVREKGFCKGNEYHYASAVKTCNFKSRVFAHLSWTPVVQNERVHSRVHGPSSEETCEVYS